MLEKSNLVDLIVGFVSSGLLAVVIWWWVRGMKVTPERSSPAESTPAKETQRVVTGTDPRDPAL